MLAIVEVARVSRVEDPGKSASASWLSEERRNSRSRVPLVRFQDRRSPLPDSSIRAESDRAIALRLRERGRDGVEVGEADVARGGIDGVRDEEEGELGLRWETTSFGLGSEEVSEILARKAIDAPWRRNRAASQSQRRASASRKRTEPRRRAS